MPAPLSAIAPTQEWHAWRGLSSAHHTPMQTYAASSSYAGAYYATEDPREDNVLPPINPVAAASDSLATLHPVLEPSLNYGPPTAYMRDDAAAYQSHSAVTPTLPVLDWFADYQQQRPSHNIVEKTCEMICYLWFSSAPAPGSPNPSKRSRPDPAHAQPFFPHSSSSTASLQFVVAPTFVRFMQKVLETTQVSQSVIVLALQYIYRMKARNRFMAGAAGSEYRVALAALMLANKFVDDNTYTNKTWADVSGIELAEINRMEREFLLGIDFGLYVDARTYDRWLNLLKGLAMAKERELQQWTRARWRGRVPRVPRAAASRSASTASPRTHATARARSTSPPRDSPRYAFTAPDAFAAPVPDAFAAPAPAPAPAPDAFAQYASPPQPPVQSIGFGGAGSKRSAADAFSPGPAPPRAPGRLTLEIPQGEFAGRDGSPMESLQSFVADLSLGASPADRPPGAEQWLADEPAVQALVSAYRADDRARPPQNLYFYTLACSPMDTSNARKARLHYHQPAAPPPAAPLRRLQAPAPRVVQSASASPADGARALRRVPTLPSFSEFSRELPPPPVFRHAYAQPEHGQLGSARYSAAQLPPLPQVLQQQPRQPPYEHEHQQYEYEQQHPPLPPPAQPVHPHPQAYQHHHPHAPSQPQQQPPHLQQPHASSAPFANAGPPGYQFYPTASPDVQFNLYRPRGRRL